MKNSDTGHIKNMANFQILLQILATYGPKYNPGPPILTISKLKRLNDQAIDAINNVNIARAAWKSSTNKREKNFDEMDKLLSKIYGAYQSFYPDKESTSDLSALIKKVNGYRKLTKADAGKTTVKEGGATEPAGEIEEVRHISTSQQSFDYKLQHFSQIVTLLEGAELYQPNEPELQLEGLRDYYNNLISTNKTANEKNVLLKTALIQRNEVLYEPEVGLTEVAKRVKAYVKSVFGVTSDQYQALNGVRFKRLNN